MSDRELMQQALDIAETAEADLEEAVAMYIARYGENFRPHKLQALRDDLAKCVDTMTALRERLAQPEQKPFMVVAPECAERGCMGHDDRVDGPGVVVRTEQEPVAWTPIEQPYPQGCELDILMGDGSVLCAVLPQSDGDLWWGGSGTGEKFIDPQYASVTHWRIHSDTAPQPRQWVGLTDEEMRDLEKKFNAERVRTSDEEYLIIYPGDYWDWQRAIEAKLREKNA